MGVTTLGPLLIRYGTRSSRTILPRDPHRRTYLVPGLFRAQRRFRSRASLRTEAVPDGDDWVVNGQRFWTTLANGRQLDLPSGAHRQAAKKQHGITSCGCRWTAPASRSGRSPTSIWAILLSSCHAEMFSDARNSQSCLTSFLSLHTVTQTVPCSSFCQATRLRPLILFENWMLKGAS